MLYKTQGIIIKRSNLGEFDRLLTVYSKDFGKILLRGKSIRKNQAKLKGHLELFLCSHLMIAPARRLNIITGAETIEAFPYLHRSLSALATAYYFSELIDKLIAGPEKDENIWQLLLFSFGELDKKGVRFKQLIVNFESQLLRFLGYEGHKQNNLAFIESLAKEKIHSYYLLVKLMGLL